QSNLRGRLSSPGRQDFLTALQSLVSMDEPGALELWKVAINNPDPELARRAWQSFPGARAELSRKESVPQIARVSARHDVVASTVEAAGMELQILADDGEGTVVVTPAFGLDRLRSAGLAVAELFDSVAELQRASRRGDTLARRLDSAYQNPPRFSASEYQVRVAVVDLRNRTEPAAGYSDWLGEPENILMRNASWLAYLDTFATDGTEMSINAHIDQQYNKRGYRIAGL